MRAEAERPQATPPATQPEGSRTRAYLYDASGADREIEVSGASLKARKDDELLWVDVIESDVGPDGAHADLLGELGVEKTHAERGRSTDRPRLTAEDEYLHLNIVMVFETTDGFEPAVLDCFVGKNWILTLHEDSVDLMRDFNRPLRGETQIGNLDAPVFLASLLDWGLVGYYRVLETLEDAVDDLDEKLLTEDLEQAQMLRKLVRLRRWITELRHLLAPHRDILAQLAQPDSGVFSDSGSSANFQRVYDRLEKAISSVDSAREMLVGSFDVFMTQTAQRTNDVMKTLTLVSVMLLPSAVLAGILGMNFQVSLFDHAYLFWAALGVMFAFVAAAVLVARRRRWI